LDKTNEQKCCGRCGIEAERLYEIEHITDDEYGDSITVKLKVCWSCDFDLMNGGNMDEEVSDIFQRRKEEAYEFDPINVENPY